MGTLRDELLLAIRREEAAGGLFTRALAVATALVALEEYLLTIAVSPGQVQATRAAIDRVIRLADSLPGRGARQALSLAAAEMRGTFDRRAAEAQEATEW